MADEWFNVGKIKIALKKAKNEPIPIAFGVGAEPQDGQLAMHPKRTPEFLGKALKKEGFKPNRILKGMAKIEGPVLVVTCEAVVPKAKKSIKHFLKTNPLPKLQVQLIGPDGEIYDEDDEDELDPAAVAPESKVEAADEDKAAFMRRITQITPRLKKALTEQGPDAKPLGVKFKDAHTLGQNGDYTRAMTLLDELDEQFKDKPEASSQSGNLKAEWSKRLITLAPQLKEVLTAKLEGSRDIALKFKEAQGFESKQDYESGLATLDKVSSMIKALTSESEAPPEGQPPSGSDGSAGKKVRFDPVVTQIPEGGSAVRIGRGRPRSNAVIAPPKVISVNKYEGTGGKKLEVVRKGSGKIAYTAPPPKVGEITFSGGGGKGTALPGAVKALYESGVLEDTTKIAGASVGSMTAALVAAGITPTEFLEVADADSTTNAITEGTGGTKKGLLARALKNKFTTNDASPLTGKGLEDIVRDVLDQTLRKRMSEYVVGCAKEGKQPSSEVVEITEKLSGNKSGPTFGDYRVLAKNIPAIKEVVMTGTYTTEYHTKDSGKKGKKLKNGNEDGQLYVFDADSEPDLEVAIAVHASASFPGAFKPIDIKIASGLTVTFIDGGVMNNTPTSSSIGNERDLDPMPQQRGVTFVFDDESGTADNLLEGRVDPAQGFGARVADWFTGSNNAGAEYAKNKSAADKPGEIVVVPLVVDYEDPKTGKTKKYDMRGTGQGTLNFNPPQSVRDDLRGMTEEATLKQIAEDGKPRTREFDSDAQMFVSIPLDELKTLAKSDYTGAKEAVTFREHVAEMVAKLQKGVKKALAGKGGRAADALQDKNVSMALDELDKLAGAEKEFQAYVGRELNKKPDLDLMLEAARRINRSDASKNSPTMDAADAVAEGLRAHTFADNILKQLVYPKMKHEPEGGAGILTLLTVEQLLRNVKEPADVNQAIDLGVKHFKNKSDRRIPKRGHREFAQQLEQRRMRPAT